MHKPTFRVFAVSAALLLAAACRTTSYQETAKGAYALKRVFPGNTWEALVQLPIKKAHKAVLEGLEDLEVDPMSSQVDKISGTIEAMFADHVGLEVKLVAVSPQLTRVQIRCGLKGDKTRTELVFRAVEKHL